MAQIQTDTTGQIVARPEGDRDKLLHLVQRMAPAIAKALPRHVSPDRMSRIVTTALRTTPKLAECTPASFLGCVMQLAQLGLEPNTPLGHAYLIPRVNRKQGFTYCTQIIGYQGMIDIARRSGMVSNVYAYAVREGDEFAYQLGTERSVRHVPSEERGREERKLTHVYAVAKYASGGDPDFIVLTQEKIEARRKRSSASSGPWATDYEAMALKTAVRALWPWIPKSTEMASVERIEAAADTDDAAQALDPEIREVLEATGIAPADAAAADAERLSE